MSFPIQRPRRLRLTPAIRKLVRETTLDPGHLIQPLFVVEGRDLVQPIESMPGQSRFSVDRIVDQSRRVFDAGIPAILLFGVPDQKDESGTGAYAADGVVQRAIESLKGALPELLVITDVCLCAYTSHGHCGVIADGVVDNDATLQLLAKTATSHARAGADLVAPSDMMDGRVAAIRSALDEENFTNVAIMSYAVKYASTFFGPFRQAADSTPQFGDRRSYQMDPANAREAVKVAEIAAAEGADIVMVKPALSCLDVICRLRESSHLPLAAYQVSGEYAMIEAAAQNGWIDRRAAIAESLLSIRRAGADIVISYFALEAAEKGII